MTAQERIEQTKQNLIDAANFVEPKKVPVSIDFGGWPYGYAGTTFKDVHDDPRKCAEVYLKAFDDIPVDMCGTATTGTHCAAAYEKLNSHKFYYNDSGTAHDQANAKFFGPEIYDEIIAAGGVFALQDKLLRKDIGSFSKPREEAYEDVKAALYEFKKYFDAGNLITMGAEERGIYLYNNGSPMTYWSELFAIFDRYRGIKNTLMDLRRHKNKLAQAVEVMWQESLPMYQYDPAEMTDPLPMADTMFHPECFLSPQQFDDYYFKHFMQVMEPLMKAGKKVFLYGEGRFIQHLERFKETPKGSMVILLDGDDPFEVNKILGGHATLMCGMTTDLLCVGTKQQCVDYVKKCFDELAPGGGFIFSTNQEIVNFKDAKPENLIAAYEEADRLSRK